MRGFLVFFVLAVAAVLASPVAEVADKGIVSTTKTIICLKDTVPIIQSNINNVVMTANDVKAVAGSAKDKVNTCVALAGEKPSIIQKIKMINCITKVTSVIKTELNFAVDNLKDTIRDLGTIQYSIDYCFR